MINDLFLHLELEELLGEQDEDIEGMQSIIYLLQKEIRQLKEENKRLKANPRDVDAEVDVEVDAEVEEPTAHDEDDVSVASEVDEVEDVREAADEGMGVVDDEVDEGDASEEEAEARMVNGDVVDNPDEGLEGEDEEGWF